MPILVKRKLLTGSKQPGFTLIEILISLLLIMAILSIFFTASTTYVTSRSSNLQSVAANIARRQMETLRKLDYAALPASGSFSDSDLVQLPQGQATQTLSSYQSSSDIKLVTISINWVDNRAPKQIKLETLIYKNGL